MYYSISETPYRFKHVVSHQPDNDDSSFGDHFHAEYELLYYIRGNVQLMIEQKLYSLRPNSLLVIKPGEHHEMIVDPLEAYERIVIRFNTKDIPLQLAEQLEKCETVYNIGGSTISSIFMQMDQHYQKISSDHVIEAMKTTLILILIYLCYHAPHVQHAEYRNERLSQIISYIDNNLTEIDTAEDIADGLGLSVSSVNKLFTEFICVPIMKYVRTKKCILAQSYISRGAKPSEIFEKCGFHDYSTFYRAFKAVTGHSPSTVQ